MTAAEVRSWGSYVHCQSIRQSVCPFGVLGHASIQVINCRHVHVAWQAAEAAGCAAALRRGSMNHLPGQCEWGWGIMHALPTG